MLSESNSMQICNYFKESDIVQLGSEVVIKSKADISK